MEKTSSSSLADVKRKLTECKVCGAPAVYSYYSVISCYACKMFFKRNAKREQKPFTCNFHGHCEVNVNNRHSCSHCRLVKCFTSGMQAEMIRSSTFKINNTNRKRKLISDSTEATSKVLVRLNQPEQFAPLNLLQSDHSTLNFDQWNLLSNLSYCYDEHSGLLIGERFIREQNNLPHKLRFKQAQLIEFIRMLVDANQSLYKKNQDFLSLSRENRSILLHRTSKHTSILSSTFIVNKVQLIDNSAYCNGIDMITHPSVTPAVKCIASRIHFDIVLMKLFLAILCFSTTSYTIYSNAPTENLSNIKEILCIQDAYIELAWRYLLYKYDFQRAVIYFSDLIKCSFSVNEGIVKLQDVQWLTDAVDSIVQQTEQTLTLNN